MVNYKLPVALNQYDCNLVKQQYDLQQRYELSSQVQEWFKL